MTEHVQTLLGKEAFAPSLLQRRSELGAALSIVTPSVYRHPPVLPDLGYYHGR